MKAVAITTLVLAIMAVPTFAKIVTETVTYELGDKAFEGTIAYHADVSDPLPGVMIVHNWMGPSEYFDERAREIAALGYVAFSADVYGTEVRPTDTAEASQAAGDLRGGDRKTLRARAAKALAVMKAHPRVDAGKTAAIGYCFGGGTVLELARSGAEVDGVISFHGNLDTPDPSDAADITAAILVLHGAHDPYVPVEDVVGFMKEMRKGGVASWEFIGYGNAVHSFTDINANSEGARYNKEADRKSFERMTDFFANLWPSK